MADEATRGRRRRHPPDRIVGRGPHTVPMVRIRSMVLNVQDNRRAAAFWSQALGYVATPHNPDFLVDPTGAGPRLHLDESDRTHLDLWVDGAAEQAAEVERLVALGAARVDWDYPDGADFVVLADPDGNLFCVVDTLAGSATEEDVAAGGGDG